MGVNDLWQILEPVKEYVPLQNLKGKTLAVDMSLWVCEAQTVKGMIGTVIKPHLRNLFFRISCLTLMDVRLVFVSEGNAPKLKAGTMSKRNEARCGVPRKPGSYTVRTERSHFKSVLKECCELLDCLGIPWVRAAGEAEAMCAYLNENGYVDGCITNDGDAFLYGAQTVYRNFTMNTKDPHVDCYKMAAIKSKLGLDRDALIGFAILLGCDYLLKGVPGVGKEQALRLVEALNGQSLLQRFKLWKLEFEEAATPDGAVEKKAHCSVCRHPGLARQHTNKGCQLCASDRCCLPHGSDYRCPCDWHQAEQKRKTSLVESNIKKKARACEHFPFKEVISEFLISKDQPIQSAQWRRPKLLFLQNFALDKMEWPRHYTCEKVLMLLSHHDMTERKLGKRDPCHLQPLSIVKTRIRNGVPCFEILWEKPEHYVYSKDQSEVSQNAVMTIEDQLSFQTAYPDMAALFHRQKAEAEKKKQKSKSKRKGRAAPLPDEITQPLSEMNLQPSYEEGWVATESEPVQKSAGQEVNRSNSPHLNPSVGFSTECSLLPKEFWRKSANEIAQPAIKHSAEIERSVCESLSLTSSENQFSACALSPSVSMLVAELHLSGIDWSQSFSTPLSERTPITQAETSEQAHLTMNENYCVPVGSASKLTEDETLKESAATPKQYSVRKNMWELLHEDASMLQDFDQLSLKDRILLKNSCQFLSLCQSNSNSNGTSFQACSTGHKSDASSPETDVESLIQDKLANLTLCNKEIFNSSYFSATQRRQQGQLEIYTSDTTTTQHTRPLTVLGKQNLTDSMEKVLGTHDPAMYSYQASKPDSISFQLEKNKAAKPHRMKLANGNVSKIQTKSVCHKVSSSSEDSDTENSRNRKQKLGVKFRATENTVMPSCIAKHNRAWAQQTKSKLTIGRASHTSVDTGHIQSKVVSVICVGKNEQAQLMHKHSKACSKTVTSQKNTCEGKTKTGSSTVLPRPYPSSVENHKPLSDDEDSIIVISVSPLPLSERLKF